MAEALLEQAAKDGLWESKEWPETLEYIFTQLDKIVRTEFPIPKRLPEPPPPLPLPDLSSSQDSTQSNKENAPAAKSTPSKPPVPSFTPAQDGEDDNEEDWPEDFPPDLAAQYKDMKKQLASNFPKYPPYTVQRLAELVLYPRKHYRFLPAYLNAVDRSIRVTSTTEIFPLPQAQLPNASGLLLNGANATPSSRPGPELGSDEALGGALLTPIPWLSRTNSQSSGSTSDSVANEKELQTESTEIVEGPNGAGRIETVNVVNGVMQVTSTPVLGSSSSSTAQPQTTEGALRAEGAVTQGELLRQEQEAGVVPLTPRNATTGADDESAGEEEKPHARGPEEIGVEDMGLQGPPGQALDMEAAVGRSKREESIDPEDASLSDAGGSRDEEMKDADEAEGGETKEDEKEDEKDKDKDKDDEMLPI